MARIISRLAASAAIVAAFSMAAAPAVAAPLPVTPRSAPVAAYGWTPADNTAHRGPGGYRGYHGHRHNDGIDAGDVVAGLLVIGGIAAIASAASNSNKDREADDYRYREPYPDQRYDYPDRGYDYSQPPQGDYRGSYSGGGIDNAVNQCVDQVERGQDRVASVDNASRTADGWNISGQLDRGGGFSCRIDNSGRIRGVDVGGADSGGYYSSSYQGGASGTQWDDQAYARAQAGSPDPYGPYDGGLGG